MLIFVFCMSEIAGYLFLQNAKKKNGRLFQFDVEEYFENISDDFLTGFASSTWPYAPSSSFGWSRVPGVKMKYSNGAVNSTNLDGVRFVPNVSAFPTMISAYGDSFTEGDEVNNDQTWLAHIAYGKKINVLNYGVSGYGPDQALLRLEQNLANGKKTPIVILGMIPENMNRLLNLFRPYYTFPHSDWALGFKPAFILKGESYELLNLVPSDFTDRISLIKAAQKASHYDEWYKTRTGQDRFPYTINTFRFLKRYGLKPQQTPDDLVEISKDKMLYILEIFSELSVKYHFHPVLALLPGYQDEVNLYVMGGSHWLGDFLDTHKRANMTYVNVIEKLAKLPNMNLDKMMAIHHYSEYGNQKVAQVLIKELVPLFEKQSEAFPKSK